MDSDLPTLLTPPTLLSNTPTVPYAEPSEREGESLAPGQLLGDRYRIESLLGRGGMGEVWRAYDLKLRLEVALKSLHPKLFETEDALELLRDEVRAAREVTSPNVCRLYDLVEIGDLELVSMEYVDGATLHEYLKQHGPLELKEANEIASQLLAGLESVHEAGLVHRDIKPENVMLTRAGRVVLMDFGLTSPSGSGSIGGTPAYMPPEQARGEATDARADVFSTGMVLAEMLSADRGPDESSRQSSWRAVREEPPKLPESPWKSILARAVSVAAEPRFATAAELARALEEVAFRVEGVEHERPYPGLAPFQKEDAEFFFGREAEVEAVWKRLQQVHLLGLMGPSGSGKSSFINAGLIPATPDGWFCVRMSPSTDPFASLGRALLPELETDREALGLLSSLEGPELALEPLREKRAKHGELLVIVDQFEELFTQSSADEQRRFADLLGRAAVEADVHVLLSMRDDYLFECQPFEVLRPLFSELTPLGPPTGSSLRRAIVQPALRCGYRFEDEMVVEEMLHEVTKERAALPLIAFTAAQLWERRDKETGLLSRDAYEAIGGVGGALAQHAEATLQQIGQDHISNVRELFRNLVTADGTRASRERDELLSVFAEKGEAKGGQVPFFGVDETQESSAKKKVPVPLLPENEESVPLLSAERVLDALIDSRLLTSYEIPEREGRPGHQRVEIIHESLLTAWPRLMRWQMQDAEGAKLRGELRHQSQLWDEKDRPDDLLWTGTAYQEFLIWLERYPGGLTTIEEEYARAMTAHAERQRRRRRFAITAAFGILLLILGVITYLGWRADLERRRAEAQARRAEAAKLLALAQLRAEVDPTEALAFTTASLELADTSEARYFALRTLWETPVAFERISEAEANNELAFSPNGNRLVTFGNSDEMQVLSLEGGAPLVLSGHGSVSLQARNAEWLSDDLLATINRQEGRARIWSLPGGELVQELEESGAAAWTARNGDLFTEVFDTDEETGHELYHLRRWRMQDGEVEELGTVDMTALGLGYDTWSWFDRHGEGWISPKGKNLRVRPLPIREDVPDRLVAPHENPFFPASYPPDDSNGFWTRDLVTGDLSLWDLSRAGAKSVRLVSRPEGLEEEDPVRIEASGRWISSVTRQIRLWDLDSWSGARPLRLRRAGPWEYSTATVHPGGGVVAAVTRGRTHLTFWPLRDDLPRVVEGYDRDPSQPLAFSPEGMWLATISWDGVQLLPLPGSTATEARILSLSGAAQIAAELAFDPRGSYLCLVGLSDSVGIVPVDGRPASRLDGLSKDSITTAVAVSPSGALVASAPWRLGPWKLKIWNLENGERRLFDLPEGKYASKMERSGAIHNLAFSGESTLYSGGVGGVRRWDLATGTHELVFTSQDDSLARMAMAADGRSAVIGEQRVEEASERRNGVLKFLDLDTGEVRELPAFGEGSHSFVIDSSGTVLATCDDDGIIQVGRVSEEGPHLLLGHEGAVTDLAISPDGRWVASRGQDHTLRLWPVPDLDQPALHTLPHDELIAKLKSLTNLRAVRDPESSTGWSIELGPFPGWDDVPTW